MIKTSSGAKWATWLPLQLENKSVRFLAQTVSLIEKPDTKTKPRTAMENQSARADAVTPAVCAAGGAAPPAAMGEGAGAGPPAMKYAGFWIRVAAAVLDGVFLILFRACLMFVEATFALLPLPPTYTAELGGFMFFVMVLVAIGYQTYWVGKWGATLGKMICGLKVVTAQGEPVSYLLAFARDLAKVLDVWTLGIGYLMAGWNPQKKALHDFLCGTRVIDTARRPGQPQP